jgi:hypothetical protein
MNKFCLLLGSVIFAFIVSGCNNQVNENSIVEEIGNPTAEDILAENPDADIFMVNDVIYKNAEKIEWINEQELTLDNEVAEITKQTTDSEKFENGTATKLPVGTKIYELVAQTGDVYGVVIDGEEIYYLGLREG